MPLSYLLSATVTRLPSSTLRSCWMLPIKEDSRFITASKSLTHRCTCSSLVSWSLLSIHRLLRWYNVIYKSVLALLPTHWSCQADSRPLVFRGSLANRCFPALSHPPGSGTVQRDPTVGYLAYFKDNVEASLKPCLCFEYFNLLPLDTFT